MEIEGLYEAIIQSEYFCCFKLLLRALPDIFNNYRSRVKLVSIHLGQRLEEGVVTIEHRIRSLVLDLNSRLLPIKGLREKLLTKAARYRGLLVVVNNRLLL